MEEPNTEVSSQQCTLDPMVNTMTGVNAKLSKQERNQIRDLSPILSAPEFQEDRDKQVPSPEEPSSNFCIQTESEKTLDPSENASPLVPKGKSTDTFKSGC